MPEPLSAPEGEVVVPIGRARSAFVASLTPLALYATSRALVWGVFALVAARRHQGVGHYLARWDSHWYLRVARSGYASAIPPGHGSAAQSDLGFFPLLPLLIRTVHWVTRLSYPTAGEVVSLATGASAALAVWWLVRTTYPRVVATWSVALIVFSPAAVVFSLIYSEGLIITLASICLWGLERHRWIAAGLAAGLATACDPVATAIVVPCALSAWWAWRDTRDARAWWALALAPTGVLAFFGYLWIHTGSPWSWYLAQRAGWQAGPFGTGVFYSLYEAADHGVADLTALMKTLGLVVVIIVAVLWRRSTMPRAWAAYVITVVVYGVFSPFVGLSPRLLLRGFPLVTVVAATLTPRRLVVVVALSAVVMCVLSVASTTLAWIP